jgi:hypothetical protein
MRLQTGTWAERREILTNPANWQIQVLNLAVFAEDLFEMVFVDVLRESLDNNLRCGVVSMNNAIEKSEVFAHLCALQSWGWSSSPASSPAVATQAASAAATPIWAPAVASVSAIATGRW